MFKITPHGLLRLSEFLSKRNFNAIATINELGE